MFRVCIEPLQCEVRLGVGETTHLPMEFAGIRHDAGRGAAFDGPHLQGRKGRFKAVICLARFKDGADAVDLLDQLARKRNSIHPELR